LCCKAIGQCCPHPLAQRRILIATTNRTFKSDKALKDFGYKPRVGMEEALGRTLASFQVGRVGD